MSLGPQQMERLTARLWPDEGKSAFAILDGAGIPNLLDKLYDDGGPEFECLFPGKLEPDMAQVAPYLVRLQPHTPFLEWVYSGWGEHWGILAVLPANLDTASVRRHFRKHNIVYGPDGAPLYFRYYDPRVLPWFAATCDGQQLQALFGPVTSFIMESEKEGEARVLTLAGDSLVQDSIPLR